jgi:hypothetical protein
MTKLEAVNKVLRSVGQYAVAALDTGGVTAAAEAEREIDTQNASVQREEDWAFNTRLNVTLAIDGGGKLTPPANTINIQLYNPQFNVIIVGGFLYDTIGNTDVFTADQKATYTFLVTWLDIPESAQDYIVALAAEKLCEQRGQRDRARDLREAVVTARGKAYNANTKATNANMLGTYQSNLMRGSRLIYPFGV